MRQSRYCILGVVALVALVLSGSALAKCGHHKRKGNPTVSQYVEPIHTSCGSGAAGGGGKPVRLAPGIAGKLHGAKGAALRSIATDQALGAQPKNLRGDVNVGGGANPLSASVGALGGGSGARLLILLGLMAGAAAVLLGAAVRRRRSAR